MTWKSSGPNSQRCITRTRLRLVVGAMISNVSANQVPLDIALVFAVQVVTGPLVSHITPVLKRETCVVPVGQAGAEELATLTVLSQLVPSGLVNESAGYVTVVLVFALRCAFAPMPVVSQL